MTLLLLLVALAVVGVTAAVVAGGLGSGMPAPVSGPPPAVLPEGRVRAADLDPLRFRLGLRGYRMDEVDAVLARLREELARREAEADVTHTADRPVADRPGSPGLQED